MPIREFLRGGYQNLTESTVVMKHGHPVFTVIPQKKKVAPKPDIKGGPEGV